MIETEWLECSDPGDMLEFLRGKASDRKLRLFACGCCRHVWDHLPSDLPREAVEIIERVVDGLAEDYELVSVWRRREGREKVTTPLANPWQGSWEAARDVAWETARLGVRREQRRLQAALLRCVVGNPFRPTPSLPSAVSGWNDGTIPKIVHGIYDERAFDRLPILADALLDAGCDDEDILAHCRGAGPHVRGCWVIDLILGKH